jgi:hypothetical protein
MGEVRPHKSERFRLPNRREVADTFFTERNVLQYIFWISTSCLAFGSHENGLSLCHLSHDQHRTGCVQICKIYKSEIWYGPTQGQERISMS